MKTKTVKITRNRTNPLYTEGILSINGEVQSLTIESTSEMLPAGLYRLQLITIHAHLRELIVHDWDTGSSIGIRISPTATSHIGCHRESAIAIGEELIPGALYKSTPVYERIVKRLEKCQKRREHILLVIDEEHCRHSSPCRHWLTPCHPEQSEGSQIK